MRFALFSTLALLAVFPILTPNAGNFQGSARGGAWLKAGVIGLQRHGPTTDLSFRNIRFAELSA